MPPILALTLTTIFILFLLRLERKQNPSVSHALWLPTLWMILISGKALAVWFGLGGSGGMEEGSVLDRNALSVLLFIGVVVLVKRHFNWKNAVKDNLWLIVLLCYMLISIVWSDMPFISLKRWIRQVAIAVIMGFVIATEDAPREAIKSIIRRVIYIQIPLSFLLIKYYINSGVKWGRWTGEVMWIGVTYQKNGLVLLCVLAIFFLIWALIRRWRKIDTSVIWYQTYVELFIIFLSLWMATGPKHSPTYSATATAAFAIGLTAFLGLLWLKNKNIILGANLFTAIIVFIIIYGTITPFIGSLTIIDVSGLLGRSENLTGRGDIWAKLIPAAKDNFFLGVGFGGFWTDEWREIVKTSDAHNGFLDTMLNTGFIGLFFSSIFLISSCRKAQQEMMNDFDWGAFWFCIILMVVLHNITEASLDSFTGLIPLIIFLHISSQSKDKSIKEPST